MELILKRIYKGERYTIGKLYVDGKYFCDTLEDCDRGLRSDMPLSEIKTKKIYGVTAIPTGRYPVILSYSPRFKKILPRLCNVKGFDGVLIHAGNRPEDTSGCVLVGYNKVKGQVLESRATMEKLMALIDEKADDDVITLTIS